MESKNSISHLVAVIVITTGKRMAVPLMKVVETQLVAIEWTAPRRLSVLALSFINGVLNRRIEGDSPSDTPSTDTCDRLGELGLRCDKSVSSTMLVLANPERTTPTLNRVRAVCSVRAAEGSELFLCFPSDDASNARESPLRSAVVVTQHARRAAGQGTHARKQARTPV